MADATIADVEPAEVERADAERADAEPTDAEPTDDLDYDPGVPPTSGADAPRPAIPALRAARDRGARGPAAADAHACEAPVARADAEAVAGGRFPSGRAYLCGGAAAASVCWQLAGEWGGRRARRGSERGGRRAGHAYDPCSAPHRIGPRPIGSDPASH
jgi:hypothetical protein